MTKPNFYIITGGPGAGKTSMLRLLASRGYSFVPETAREIIRQRKEIGLSPRPDPTEFAQQMFSVDFDNYLSRTHLNSLTFFDRSFLDSAYLLHKADQRAFEEIKGKLFDKRFNEKVFVAPPWEEIYQTDSERDQTFDESIEVYNNLCNWYAEQHYEIIPIPKESIENRCTFILNQI